MLKKLVLYTAILLIAALTKTTGLASREWKIIRDSEIAANISYIKFFDEKTGVAYGSGYETGFMLTTNDGGKTWSQRKDAYGYGMFVSPQDGVFINPDNEGGTVRYTENGGKTWKSFKIKSDAGYLIGFYDNLYFVSLKEGWVVANPKQSLHNCILNTKDGGKTWNIQLDTRNMGDFVFINDIFFLDSKIGWGVGWLYKDNVMKNLVVGTSDGGANWWQKTWEIKDSGFRKAFFANSKVGWASDNKRIFHTRDGGKTWEPVLDKSCIEIYFLDEMHGWILQPNSLLCTSDGGKTWDEKQVNTPQNLGLKSLSFINEHEGWVGGSAGLIMHTKDSGETWEIQTNFGFNDLYSVDFVSPECGIAVEWSAIIGSEILKTEDGLTWQSDNLLGKIAGISYFNQIDFIDGQTGWLSDGSTLWKTDDGRKNFKVVRTTGIGLIRDICFVNQINGWVIDDTNGNIYRTVNGGQTWDISAVATNVDFGIGRFSKVTFIDENNGWAIKMSGSVYSTSDGGITWKLTGEIPSMDPNGICFANENEGWIMACGNGLSRIFHTKDGGKNWHLDAEFQNTWLSDICYDSEEHVYAVGSYGIVVRYTDPELNQGKFVVEPEGKKEALWGNIKQGNGELPQTTAIYQNYPNPFNPETWIPYQLKEASNISIDIYDANGYLVRSLYLGMKEAGKYVDKIYSVHWDGRNEKGERVKNGVYFYILRTDSLQSEPRKMILLE